MNNSLFNSQLVSNSVVAFICIDPKGITKDKMVTLTDYATVSQH